MGQTLSGLFSVNKEMDKKDSIAEHLKTEKLKKEKLKPKKKKNPLLTPILQRSTN